jgi:hypothetical protein
LIYSFKEQRQDIITEIELLFSSYSSHVIYDSSGKLLQVISGLDLFSQVGANTPLVIEDLRMLVGREGELSIRLEGVTGAAILCGISIRKETTATYVEETGMLAVKGSTDTVLSQQTQVRVIPQS